MIEKIKIFIKLLIGLRKLKIIDSGIDTDGDAFVRLSNGLFFFGEIATSKIYYYIIYLFLTNSIKNKMPKECIKVAIDIVIRYYEGSLKYGGPKKQLKYRVNFGDKVAEMGAYQGFYSIRLAQQVGSSGKVIAIEPHKNNYRLLKKNKDANFLDQLLIVNVGVWDSKNKLQFYHLKNDTQSSSIDLYNRILFKDNKITQYEMNVDRLDNILQDLKINDIDMMIIQLNGAEINALKGLSLYKPKNFSIAARYNINCINAVDEILSILKSKQYIAEVIQDKFIFATLKQSIK